MKSARHKMKKFLPHTSKIALLFSLIVLMGGFFFPQTAEAGIKDNIADALMFIPGWLSIVLLQLLSFVLYLSGTILNYVTDYTIVNMADNIGKAGINEVWRTIRDVANMSFIFVLLYAAIRLILGIGGGTQRLIVNIVLVAILINFSLFFTKLVIDASNILAVTFYGAMAPGALSGDDIINTGLANSIMEPLKIQTLAKEVSGFDGTKLITVGIIGSVFVLMAAFVFFAISIMLLIRFVVLIFVLILSPIAFIAMILPAVQGQAKQWKDALLGQAFFAPIFFMLVWIVISISQNLYTSDGSLAGALNGSIDETKAEGASALNATPSAGDIGLIVNFLVVIALLIAALTIAKSWANKAGPAVSGATKWATGAAGSVTYGLPGNVGRKTIGKAGQSLAENEWLKDKAPTNRAARLALAAGRKTGASSFDFRASKVGGATVGTLEAGKAAGKGGYAKQEEEKEKRRADEAKRYEAKVSYKDVEELVNTSDKAKERDEKIKMATLAMDPSSPASVKETQEQIEKAKAEFAREDAALREKAEKDAADNAKTKTKERKERFAENLSKTTLLTPNLYAGVKTDRQAALKIRQSLKEKSKKEKLADLATEVAKEEEEEKKKAEEGGKPEAAKKGDDEDKK